MKTIGFLGWAIMALMVCGCARAEKVYTPEGRAGYNIDCSGNLLDWRYCHTKARDICGARGYKVIVSNQHNDTDVQPNRLGLYEGDKTKRYIIIECR